MADPEKPLTRIPSVMEDPSVQAVARIYAKAFLGAAGAGGGDSLEELQSFLDDVLERYPQFRDMLLSGIVGRDEKLGFIDRVIAPHASPVLASFLRTLARHDRLELLPAILAESRTLHETRLGQKRVQVTSARLLSEEQLNSIGGRLRDVYRFEPIVETNLDESLLGGVVIRIGDTVYDSSLRTRLKGLRERLRQRTLHEIQSGRNRFSHPAGD